MNNKNNILPLGSKPWGRKTNNLKPNTIKEQIDPLEFYTCEVAKGSVTRRDWVDAGLCPFHADNKSGSFKINLVSGAYKCFSCNASGGDVIAFTMQVYGLSFPEALAKLANEWGIIC